MYIIKRDGRQVSFDRTRIVEAIYKCLIETWPDKVEARLYAQEATTRVVDRLDKLQVEQLTVEIVQDTVETVLMADRRFDEAKRYILFREARRLRREANRPVPDDVRAAFAASDPYFPTPLQKFQFFDKYSRYNYDLGRRETWIETVDRSVNFLRRLSDNMLDDSVYDRIRKGILEMRVTPSMRLLAMAGPAAERNNIAIYNCSYLPVEDLYSFVEALIISMSGCGVGFSVESKYVENFPRIRRQTGTVLKLAIDDSSEGWAYALNFGLESWFDGYDVHFDYSRLRPMGAPLRIKGGQASGPEPLREMMNFIRNRILSRQGSFLRPIDAHDIMCAVGSAAVSGGVRRTAMISLFDFDDEEMLHCKSGDFERENKQRWNANNSAVWPERGLSEYEFLKQFTAMINSGRGEPGIFNRKAAKVLRPSRRQVAEFGTNPCGEINLRPWQFCNLSAVVARREDALEDLYEKVELATIIGTIQSMATHFPGLREKWVQNCEEERLLGVDITGQMDCPVVQDPAVMEKLRHHAVEVNRNYAAILGIRQSASITCVKPSGNTSQLVNCSSGLHARWSQYYIRNVRLSASSPLAKVLKDANVPMTPENGDDQENPRTWVISFPVKSPDGAITRNDRSALEQCEYWLRNKLYWTEHNPSVTITYKPHEIVDLLKWVWDNRDRIGGMAFLPSFDAKYNQLPYIEIDQEEYERRVAEFPEIDFSLIYRHESRDQTSAAQELACSAGMCEIDVV